MSWRTTVAFRVFLVGIATTLSACDSDPDSPTKPSPTLVIEELSTLTQLDQIAVRVELRMRVTAGLTDFADAVGSARATSEVCGDECASRVVVAGPVIGDCDTAVGSGQAEIAIAWMDDDVVGVDFCVPTLTTVQVYETTILSGSQRSNTIETRCAIEGGILTCESD